MPEAPESEMIGACVVGDFVLLLLVVRLLLTASAYQARSAEIEDRSSAESVLSGALGMMLAERESIVAKRDQALLHELEVLSDKIRIAIAIHVEAVTRTQLIRSKLVFRLFRLAGKAPLPVTYEFEADAI